MSDNDLYTPTVLTTKVALNATQLNQSLEQNIHREVEKKFANNFFSFGHVRPGTIQILERSIGNKLGASDFNGKMYFRIQFKAEVYLPIIGQEIEARVQGVNKYLVLAKSSNNRLTIVLNKAKQTQTHLFDRIFISTRVKVKIKDFKIDNQNGTIIVTGDLQELLEGVYQNYQLPSIVDMSPDIHGSLRKTDDIHDLFANYGNFIDSVNVKSRTDSYNLKRPSDKSNSEWLKTITQPEWTNFKYYWNTAKFMVEDFELVYPSKLYNQGHGVAKTPLKSTPISRTYFKFWEILHRYPDIIDRLDTSKPLHVLTLNDPGAIIQCVTHYRQKTGNLTDYYTGFLYEPKSNKKSSDKSKADPEETPEDSHLRWDNPKHKEQLDKLKQNLYLDYHDVTIGFSYILDQIIEEDRPDECDLIIADGGLKTMNVYNYEEVVNYKLFYGEIAVALLTQKIGGNFVLKMFDIMTHVSKQLLTLLNHYYNEIFVTKPDFSRPASSEKYIVCLGFKGLHQGKELVQKTLFEMLNVWNERIQEDPSKLYAKNDSFLIELFDYTFDENDELGKKIAEINQDHLTKQSEHINKAIHLIHTRNILDSKKILEIKKQQLKNSILWCQKYNLEYDEDIDFHPERLVPSDILNTKKTLEFNLTTVQRDQKETYDYIQTEYNYLTNEYFQSRLLSNQIKLNQILSDPYIFELYTLKNNLLNPVNYLNQELNTQHSTNWFSIYELLDTFRISKSQKQISFFVNLDDIQANVTQATLHYFKKKKVDVSNWNGSIDYRHHQQDGILPDPANQFQSNNWLMAQTHDEERSKTKTTGDLSQDKTLRWFFNHFEIEKNQVDLYISDLRVPVEKNLFDQERYFIKEILAQYLIGLKSLKNGGTMICRQYTMLENLSFDLLEMLTTLFEEVHVTKPLISPAEDLEIYLVCRNFKKSKYTSESEWVNLYGLLPDKSELENPEYTVPTIKSEKDPQLKQNLIYIMYRLYVLNQIPKFQINLDLIENERYSLNSRDETIFRSLISEKEELLYNDSLTDDQISELQKIQDTILKLYSDISERIVNEDFNYILVDKVKNWMAQHQI